MTTDTEPAGFQEYFIAFLPWLFIAGFMFFMLIGIICVGNYQILTAFLGGNLKMSKLLSLLYGELFQKVYYNETFAYIFKFIEGKFGAGSI